MKATAVAHPIQGLVKYHGLRDPVLRIPFHDSISVATGPISTRTTVEVCEDDPCVSVIDGEEVVGRALERVRSVVDAVREGAEDDRPFRMESRNDFPQYVGLGSSSSGFAALAQAAAEAYGWRPGPEKLSQIARLGAGSAARSLTGGVSDWMVRGERSWSEQAAPPEELDDWHIVVPLVEHAVPTEGVHADILTSPLFQARLQYIEDALTEMRRAVAERDLERIWALAEADTLNLHAVTMTSSSGHLTWQPATVAVMQIVRGLRDDGVPAWFSIDTGATAYINTRAEHADAIADAVSEIPGVAQVLRLRPAPGAHGVDEHLF